MPSLYEHAFVWESKIVSLSTQTRLTFGDTLNSGGGWNSSSQGGDVGPIPSGSIG
jgi:hypothetical protein